MLSNTARPSSMAATMLAKLSSSRIMSAASRATSVPVMPMAMPMSAVLQRRRVVHAVAGDGHDFAFALQRLTIAAFLVGADAREKISGASSASCSCAGDMRRSSSPDHHRLRRCTRPISRAMAAAVCGWSPVTMMTLMPACGRRGWPWHLGRGGS